MLLVSESFDPVIELKRPRYFEGWMKIKRRWRRNIAQQCARGCRSVIGRTNDDDDEKPKIIITIKERCGLWGLQECDHWAGLTPSVGSL